MNTKLEIIIFAGIGLLFLINIFWIWKTEKRLKRFFAGKKGLNLENTIISLEKNIAQLENSTNEISVDLKQVNDKLKKSIRGLETLRFNPFPDQGSNQSFAIAMLNEENDGLILSSLYSRERMSIFAKPIKNGTSSYELTEEEKEILRKTKI